MHSKTMKARERHTKVKCVCQ